MAADGTAQIMFVKKPVRTLDSVANLAKLFPCRVSPSPFPFPLPLHTRHSPVHSALPRMHRREPFHLFVIHTGSAIRRIVQSGRRLQATDTALFCRASRFPSGINLDVLIPARCTRFALRELHTGRPGLNVQFVTLRSRISGYSPSSAAQ